MRTISTASKTSHQNTRSKPLLSRWLGKHYLPQQARPLMSLWLSHTKLPEPPQSFPPRLSWTLGSPARKRASPIGRSRFQANAPMNHNNRNYLQIPRLPPAIGSGLRPPSLPLQSRLRFSWVGQPLIRGSQPQRQTRQTQRTNENLPRARRQTPRHQQQNLAESRAHLRLPAESHSHPAAQPPKPVASPSCRTRPLPPLHPFPIRQLLPARSPRPCAQQLIIIWGALHGHATTFAAPSTELTTKS